MNGGTATAAQSLVTTVVTRSSPEIVSSALMGPVSRTIKVTAVIAATANSARTAALSQYRNSVRSTVSAGASAAAPASEYWYYCRPAKAYYPYVKSCPVDWTPVPPRPSARP